MNNILKLAEWGYSVLIKCASLLQSPFLLLIRLYWGWQLIVSARGHLDNYSAMVQHFKEWHVPFPELNVYFSAYTEYVCGALLFLGILSRIITIPLIVNFCVAYLTASHDTLVNAFKDPDSFVSDAAFLYMLAAIIIFLFGPGSYSLDHLLSPKIGKETRHLYFGWRGGIDWWSYFGALLHVAPVALVAFAIHKSPSGMFLLYWLAVIATIWMFLAVNAKRFQAAPPASKI